MLPKNVTALLIITLGAILVFSIGIFPNQIAIIQEVSAQGLIMPTVNTYGNAWDGVLAYGVNGYLVVMSTNGTLLSVRSGGSNYGVVKNIAQDTLLFQGEPQTTLGASSAPTYATHIWNIATNTTQDYPNVIGHHDIEYDPSGNTFLTLQEYVRQIGSNLILFDKIVELDAAGNVLWTWDTFDHLPLSQASSFNETSVIGGQTVIDFTHCNALLWEPNNNIIYLNVRNQNTFYKINQTTGQIIWACGQFGNFTLLDQNNTVVPSLWYHSHHLQQIAPNVFTMFNNDFDNITNPNDDNSQMIQFTINEQNMTAQETWSWTAPPQYYSTYLGATWTLPNGDWIGDFGPPTHQFPENQPWNFTNTGAVLVEVNSTGQIVRTITYPTGWSIYRIGLLTNMSSNPFNVAPTPSPTAYYNPLPSPTSSPTPLASPSPSPSPTPSAAPTASTKPSATPLPFFDYSLMATVVLILVVIVIIVLVILVYLLRILLKVHKKINQNPNFG